MSGGAEMYTDAKRVQDLYALASRAKLVDAGLASSKWTQHISESVIVSTAEEQRRGRDEHYLLKVADIVIAMFKDETISYEVAAEIIRLLSINWDLYDEWGILENPKLLSDWLGDRELNVGILLR